MENQLRQRIKKLIELKLNGSSLELGGAKRHRGVTKGKELPLRHRSKSRSKSRSRKSKSRSKSHSRAGSMRRHRSRSKSHSKGRALSLGGARRHRSRSKSHSKGRALTLGGARRHRTRSHSRSHSRGRGLEVGGRNLYIRDKSKHVRHTSKVHYKKHTGKSRGNNKALKEIIPEAQRIYHKGGLTWIQAIKQASAQYKNGEINHARRSTRTKSKSRSKY